MTRDSFSSLVLLSAFAGRKRKQIKKPTGRDLISDKEQAEKLLKAAEKRARKAAKRQGK